MCGLRSGRTVALSKMDDGAMKRVLAGALCIAFSVAGCGPSTPTTTGTTLAGTTARAVDMVPAVSYQSDAAAAEARHRAMLDYVSGLQRVLRQAPQTGGGEISVSVCSPSSAAYCSRFLQTGADLEGPGRAITVADFASGGSPTGFGNGFSVMYVPATANHFALSFDYSEDASSLGGSGFSMQFVYLTTALLSDIQDTFPTDYFQNIPTSLLNGNELDISDNPEYDTTTGEEIGIPADAQTVIAALDEFMGSAQQFRTYVLGRETQLLTEVKAQVDAGHVSQRVNCRYPSNGGAPICEYGPLSSAQKAKEIAQAVATIGQEESLVNRAYQSVYSLLSSQIAWTTCPGCWSGS